MAENTSSQGYGVPAMPGIHGITGLAVAAYAAQHQQSASTGTQPAAHGAQPVAAGAPLGSIAVNSAYTATPASGQRGGTPEVPRNGICATPMTAAIAHDQARAAAQQTHDNAIRASYGMPPGPNPHQQPSANPAQQLAGPGHQHTPNSMVPAVGVVGAQEGYILPQAMTVTSPPPPPPQRQQLPSPQRHVQLPSPQQQLPSPLQQLPSPRTPESTQPNTPQPPAAYGDGSSAAPTVSPELPATTATTPTTATPGAPPGATTGGGHGGGSSGAPSGSTTRAQLKWTSGCVKAMLVEVGESRWAAQI